MALEGIIAGPGAWPKAALGSRKVIGALEGVEFGDSVVHNWQDAGLAFSVEGGEVLSDVRACPRRGRRYRSRPQTSSDRRARSTIRRNSLSRASSMGGGA